MQVPCHNSTGKTLIISAPNFQGLNQLCQIRHTLVVYIANVCQKEHTSRLAPTLPQKRGFRSAVRANLPARI